MARNTAQLHRRIPRPLPAKPRLLDHAPKPSSSYPPSTTSSSASTNAIRVELRHNYSIRIHSEANYIDTPPLCRAATAIHILNRMLAGHTPSAASPHCSDCRHFTPLINELGVCKRPQPAIKTNCCPIIGSQDWCYGFNNPTLPAPEPNHQNHLPTDHHINASHPSVIAIPQPPRPPPHTNVISHSCTPKLPKRVLILSWNELSHVYAYLPTFSITTLTSRKNSKSSKRAIFAIFRHLGFTHK